MNLKFDVYKLKTVDEFEAEQLGKTKGMEPFWTYALIDLQCSRCHSVIQEGMEYLNVPEKHKVLCGACASHVPSNKQLSLF